MLQVKHLTLTHRKDLRTLAEDFSFVLNNGDKAVVIGEEGNGKSTLLKWIYDPGMVEDYCEWSGEIAGDPGPRTSARRRKPGASTASAPRRPISST